MKNTPYSRPKKFSNSGHDFSKEELMSILNKPDEKLNEYDYRCIFQTFLPAGTYRENAYFIPSILNYISYNDDGDLIYFFILWCSKNINNLKNDNLCKYIKKELLILFKEKTRVFNITSTQSGCLYPQKYVFIENFVDSLMNQNNNIWNISDFISTLFPCNNYDHAGWIFHIYSSKKIEDILEKKKDANDIIYLSFFYILCKFISCNDENIMIYIKQRILESNLEFNKIYSISYVTDFFQNRDKTLERDLKGEISDEFYRKIQFFIEKKTECYPENKSFKETILNLLNTLQNS